MPGVEDLYVVLRANVGGFILGMRESATASRELDSSLGKGMATLARFGAGVTLAAGVAAAASVKLGADFQAAMERIHTQAGASQREVESLSRSVLAMAGPVGEAPKALADGLYHIESAGFRGAKALDMLHAAAEGARIGNANLEDVTQAMIASMASGIKGVSGASDAMALLNATVGTGDMRMQQLAQAFATGILPSARSAGLSIEDVSAALATITDNATPADEAATRLRMTFALMSAPTKKATDALASIGMSSTRLATDMRQPNGLLVAVDDLKSHMEASGKTAVEQNQVIEHAFGGGRTSGAILTLLEESDRLRSKYVELGNSATRARQYQEAWAATQRTFSQQMAELRATVETLAVRLGTWLIPRIQQVARELNTGVQWLQRHRAAAEALAIAVGTVLTAAVYAYTVAMVKAAAANIAATWEFLAIAAAIALIGVGIYEAIKHWGEIQAVLEHVGDNLLHAFDNVRHAFDNVLAAAQRWGPAVLAAVVPFIGIPLLIWQHWQTISGFFAGLVDDVVGFLRSLPGRALTALAALPRLLGDAVTAAGRMMLTAFEWAVAVAIVEVAVLPVRILTILERLVRDLPALARRAWGAFVAATETVAGAAVRFAASLPGRVFTALAALGAVLVRVASAGWNAFYAATVATAGAVLRFVASIPGRVLAALASLGGLLVHLGAAMIGGLLAGAVSAGTGLARWLAGLPGAIVRALGNLGSLLYHAGQQIIDGLISGITSRIGAVAGAISSIVGKIKSHLPGSPAKEGPLSGTGSSWHSGVAIGRMLADGIALNQRAVADATALLLQPLTRTPSVQLPTGGTVASTVAARAASMHLPPAPPVAAATGGPDTFTATVPVQVIVDGRTVASSVQTVKLQRDRRNGRDTFRAG